MSTIEEEIAEVKDMILAAERDGRSEEYILSLRSELIELRKEKNILLEKFNQIGAVGKLSDIPSYLN